MPIALQNSICDSEDESDELALFNGDEGNDDATPARLPGPSEKPRQGPSIDGESHSTGSTERLRRQILDAETALYPGSNGESRLNAANDGIMPSGPSPRRRRNAKVLGLEVDSPERRSKRPKSPNAKETILHPFDIEKTNGLQTSSRFTEHSSQHGISKGDANGLVGLDDFLAHEPNLLFNDSGSTVPDNSMTAQALVEQHIRPPQPNISFGQAQSSSVPWTASDNITQASGSTRDQASNEVDDSLAQAAPPIETAPNFKENGSRSERTNGSTNDDLMKDIISRLGNRGQRSSPQVVIPPLSPVHGGPESCRQLQQATSDLTHDDATIGLPAERYQPRPSRRRATAMNMDDIDYSVVPEKAAKLRRIKSASFARQDTSVRNGDVFDVDESPRPKRQKRVGNLKPSEQSSRASDVDRNDKPLAVDVKPKASASGLPEWDVNASAGDEATGADPDHVISGAEETGQPNSKRRRKSPSKISRNSDHRRPDKATDKPNSRTRTTRRSQTTIFEDHVDYTGFQSSPNLSQQQADRKSNTLAAIKNEASPRSSKRRRVGLPEDDEEEDELALNNNENPRLEQDRGATNNDQVKKRGRGRPPKSAIAIEAVPDDAESKHSEDEEGGDSLIAEEDEPPVAPKKRGRGRPAKAQPPQSDPKEDAEAKYKPAKKRGRPPKASVVPDLEVDDIADAEVRAETTEAEPSAPERPPAAAAAEKETIDTATADEPHAATPPRKPPAERVQSHSPGKSSAKTPTYRVGLSKRSRIPPLLKMIKPPR